MDVGWHSCFGNLNFGGCLSCNTLVFLQSNQLNKSISNIVLRKVLVVFQFSISVVLIICTLVIGRQMQYISNMNLGYSKEEVFSVPLSDEAINHIDAVKSELNKMPGITK